VTKRGRGDRRSTRRCRHHGVPTKRAGSGRLPGARHEQSRGVAIGNPCVATFERAEHRAREIPHRFCRAEQPGVTRSSTKRPAVFIVNLADEPAPAPRIVLSRRDRTPQRGRWIEHERRRRDGAQQLLGLRLKWAPTGILDDESEQDETEIAVNGLGVGRVLERKRADRVLKFLPALVIAVEGKPCGEPGAVREQRSKRHVFAIVSAPVRDPLPDWIGQCERAALDELHHEARRRDHLGQGR
jgi:hypothetical protein